MNNMHKLIITLCAITFSTLLHADKFKVKYRSCYDGDTCRIDFIKNITKDYIVPKFFASNVRIRISGIDTPEIKGKCSKEKKLAKEAKRYLNEKLKQANSIIVDIDNNNKLDSLGRYLVVLYVDDININNLMLTSGYARVEQAGYHDWCK
jgi:endonuclease YncB( thermonuclease family)